MKVSVICPTYNRKNLLHRAIESFLDQDYSDAELVILDNGTTDGTTEHLKHLVDISIAEFGKCPIKVITRAINTPFGSLNELWKNCTGDLICQLHDDDFLTPNSLTFRVNLFKNNPNLHVVWGGANLVDINGNKTNFCPGEVPDAGRILKQDYINFTTLMWRRDLPFMFDDDFEFNMDWLFKIRCLKELRCDNVYAPVMNYTVHAGQETHRSRTSGAHDKEMAMIQTKLKEL